MYFVIDQCKDVVVEGVVVFGRVLGVVYVVDQFFSYVDFFGCEFGGFCVFFWYVEFGLVVYFVGLVQCMQYEYWFYWDQCGQMLFGVQYDVGDIDFL